MSYSNYAEYLAHPRFRESVNAARERSGGKCEQCHRTAFADPHHIRYCQWGEFDPPENLIMLCRECHENAHRCDKCQKVNLKARHIKTGIKVCDFCRRINP
jgi:hypothetical protein